MTVLIIVLIVVTICSFPGAGVKAASFTLGLPYSPNTS